MKLYTRTVCPKCILVKSEMARLGIELEILNMDQDPAAKETIIEQGISAAPVLEVDGKFISEVKEIIETLEKSV